MAVPRTTSGSDQDALAAKTMTKDALKAKVMQDAVAPRRRARRDLTASVTNG